VIVKKEPDNSLNPPERRAVVIAHGSASMPDTVMLRSDPSVNRIFAEQGGDDLGRGLAAVDLNGNGVDEICIGAPLFTAPGPDVPGKVRVFPDCAVLTAARSSPPALLTLHANRPNPFSSTTVIPFSAGRSGIVSLSIYDVRGRRVKTVRIKTGPGDASFLWDGRDDRGRAVSSGIYFYRVEASGASATRKLVILR
jgi:hypothetical protein